MLSCEVGLHMMECCKIGCLYREQVSFKKEVGIRVSDLVFWLTLWLNFENLIGSSNGLLPDSTKPLPEPMLTSHQ